MSLPTKLPAPPSHIPLQCNSLFTTLHLPPWAHINTSTSTKTLPSGCKVCESFHVIHLCVNANKWYMYTCIPWMWGVFQLFSHTLTDCLLLCVIPIDAWYSLLHWQWKVPHFGINENVSCFFFFFFAGHAAFIHPYKQPSFPPFTTWVWSLY